jgi:uncharacterized protein
MKPPWTDPAAATGATVTGALTKGEAFAAPSGRADDFRWPRDVANVEQATVEPATLDAAASDTGAESAKPAQRRSAMDAYASQTRREQKPVQGRPRPRLNHNAWSHQPPNFFGSGGW